MSYRGECHTHGPLKSLIGVRPTNRALVVNRENSGRSVQALCAPKAQPQFLDRCVWSGPKTGVGPRWGAHTPEQTLVDQKV